MSIIQSLTGSYSQRQVVPQRAKPGRKPSQEEPLTKRQAQNRASQRAFRERKQNHVATLEAKVAEYEAEKLTRDAKEAEAQREIRTQSEELTTENATLRRQVKDLEAAVKHLQLQAQETHGQLRAMQTQQQQPQYHPHQQPPSQGWNGCLQSGAGCRAPAHEASSSMSPPREENGPTLAARRKRPLPSRPSSSADRAGESLPLAPADHMGASTSRFGAMSIAAPSPPTFGSPTTRFDGSNGNSMSASQPLLTPFFEQPPVATTSRGCGGGGAATSSATATRGSPDLMPMSDIDMDRDCGFCTDATPCLCRGEAVLDLTGMDEDGDDVSEKANAAAAAWMDGVDQMVKIEESEYENVHEGATAPAASESQDDTTLSFSVPRRPAVTVASLLSSRLSTSSSNKPKLWATTTASASKTAAPPTTIGAGAASRSPAAVAAATGLLQASKSTATTTPSKAAPSTSSGQKKLWWTQPLSSTGTLSSTSSAMYSWTPTPLPPGYHDGLDDVEEDEEDETADEAMCSGDPRNCPACNTDPALAAFCEAVAADDNANLSEAESEATASSSQTIRPAEPYSANGARRYNAQAGAESWPNAAPQGVVPPSGDFSFSMQQRSGVSGSGSTASPARPTLPPRSLTTGPTSSATPSYYRRPRGSVGGPSHLTLPPLGSPSSSSHAQGFSIPSAFKQLRAHPGFPKWEGGLNLLADVVSGRGPATATSPTSAVRGGPSGAGAAELTAAAAATQTQTGAHHKRRRLYLENDRVEEALRMLDGGVASSGSASGSRQGATSVPCGECPCPCPWAQNGGVSAEHGHGEERRGSN
ncbi:hypothetical protein BDZ90DRAFT_183842 [Jaminaea rosea]|uniref:BZIP domain-containing protein n=1 Tax=Jaminaea rosea TaxID=1569628 RepID=A0A316UP17_9BASI|nr:hypothetical protein BDZ90DRAFT_183842 [Jaminaea rosea]PWN27026.1 hypothetical protein BDZ90DRAFT_183842 [Jaminaea rosea]